VLSFLIKILLAFLIIIIAYAIFIKTIGTPSNDRDWTEDQMILPTAQFINDYVTIRNIRNFDYRTAEDYTPRYYDKTYDLKKIKKAYFIIEPFDGNKGAAHTFLSFEFEGNQFISISVEIRKEKGETFNAFHGLLNQYELMYVIADERDVINLRANIRKDDVYVYPIAAGQDKVRELFVDMLKRANTLVEKPEFYNTLWNTCTTNIVDHVNKISNNVIPLSLEVILPGTSDKRAYDLGLIDTDLTWNDAKEFFKINERAEKFRKDPAFSVKIRQPLR
jgi:hypothetical protein